MLVLLVFQLWTAERAQGEQAPSPGPSSSDASSNASACHQGRGRAEAHTSWPTTAQPSAATQNASRAAAVTEATAAVGGDGADGGQVRGLGVTMGRGKEGRSSGEDVSQRHRRRHAVAALQMLLLLLQLLM